MNVKILVTALLLAAAGCNSSNDNSDSGPIVIEAGADVPRADVSPPTDSGPGTDASADAGADVPLPPSDAGDAGGRYVDGCFVGTPSAMTDFLNRCGGAVAFPPRPARGARLLPDGGVAPLPM